MLYKLVKNMPPELLDTSVTDFCSMMKQFYLHPFCQKTQNLRHNMTTKTLSIGNDAMEACAYSFFRTQGYAIGAYLLKFWPLLIPFVGYPEQCTASDACRYYTFQEKIQWSDSTTAKYCICNCTIFVHALVVNFMLYICRNCKQSHV